ncbi:MULTISPECIES: 2,3-dihydro-2,3-dihydroxybenzoate dehydrogenase [Pseudoalteromonas]|uniref:2,3-dihydro-2,3-dihydroxybenzoate dehydrogenase n=1 Tax=Pseudoalteromonas piscicida TaxID=43662 RepID=A0AAD0RLF6_PSEO7|nr:MULTISPECIES: 2,3-dihydro-2,3-dihydroxybenzoate dehydrogenase [Pseudoalteromonas]ASD65705.1 2,3-dihydro-2,3-dihydroxybenzoate dehydrogenase [Pseudoalteromonas piscicida]AXQ96459.1 2,3-dihydro-2,3-dihydroxybenzoate dehydrogenase [Pseudoalteromonas piscicida]AXR00743.1 2,3-dihydro-2,3-dihydroxybenzoate dehydrogenase [Pseudoalteromonas piscicida]KJY85281.1 2,3-dihydroxybenzoate-2,3-dehydrogenase [Pseudoalteromonas piscicida]MDP4490652.1 2,3-dihydro-2,3-dihydroxybenzoate dehydrogenase [Pseudoal
MSNECEFTGRIALVTGAYQGIGKALVEQLLARGAIVVAADIAIAASQLQEVTANHFQIHLDVTNKNLVQTVVEEIEIQLGALEYVASVAGILHMGTLLEQSDAQWLDTFAVNCHGPFYLCQAVANKMRIRKRGAIVAVSSNAASTPRVNMGSYCASKAALSAMIKTLALEVAPFNIRCNLVAPGSTDTQMQQQLWRDENGAEQTIQGDLTQFKLGIPLGRIASATDIANSILFLLSDQARHITMANLLVDGGATLGH